MDHVLQELVDEVRGVCGGSWSTSISPTCNTSGPGRASWTPIWPKPGKTLEDSMCQYVVNSEMPFVVKDFLATEEVQGATLAR